MFRWLTLGLVSLVIFACQPTTRDAGIRTVNAEGFALNNGLRLDFPKGDTTNLLILLHHAEGQENTELLTAEGRMRAHHLQQVFVDAQIDRIFTPAEPKCMSTVDVLAQMQDIEVVGFAPDRAADILKAIGQKEKGKRILIVGTAAMLNQMAILLQPDLKDTLPPDAYGQLLVSYGKECHRLNY